MTKRRKAQRPKRGEAKGGPDARGLDGRVTKVLGAADLVVSLLVLGAVWGVLPARWLPLDLPATLLGLAFGAAGIGLLVGAPWAPRVAKGVALASVVGGGLLFSALVWTAGHISGLYGPVGAGGAVLLSVVGLLLLPYLVLLPAAQLLVLTTRGADPG